jgi:uncharacterized protein involved in exopolysaccharide biosynthesis
MLENSLQQIKNSMDSYRYRLETSNVGVNRLLVFLPEYFMFKDASEVNTLKEQVNNLVGQITAKDEELKAKISEMETLREEIQKLRGNSDTIAVLEEQVQYSCI